jgi:uncharacterized small protein (DUF1192 family)
MDLDDLEPRNKKPPPKNLEEMSIEALGDYINTLKQEITRTENMISTKKKALEGAESFFKS